MPIKPQTARPPDVVIDYDQREGISVLEAVEWANSVLCPVTLYLYDEDKGTTDEAHFRAVEHRFGTA